MSSIGPRKIETLLIQVLTPENLSNNELKVLKKEIKDCPVLRNIQGSTNIEILWTKQ